MAQDDYFYEIQLTNKQLVFYFLAGATGLVLSFLAGVMVGRGVDQGADVQAARPVTEERVIAEETPRPAPSVEELTYSHRLEGEKTEDRLEKAKPSPAAASSAEPRVAAAAPRPAAVPGGPTPISKKPATTAAPVKSTAPPAAGPPPPAAGAATAVFALQVGAFKDRAGADALVARLKGKGFPAGVSSGQEGLFNVRVGNYGTRAEAEQVQERLRQEKLQPFVVRP